MSVAAVGHLFAGIGGGLYADLILGLRSSWAVDSDAYCATVLRARASDGTFPGLEVYECDVDSAPALSCDVLCGGFPCQAFSGATRGRNAAEKNAWPQMLRFVDRTSPPIVFMENVEKEPICGACSDLEARGYRVGALVLGCSDLGADHERDRVWALAHSDRARELLMSIHAEVAMRAPIRGGVWATGPEQCRVAHGSARRGDRLGGAGNAQSPVVAAVAFGMLLSRAVGGGRS